MPADKRYLEFSGGQQNVTSRFLQKENELDLALNVHGDNIGSFKKRLGYKRCGVNRVTGTTTAIYDGGTNLFLHGGDRIQYNNNSSNPDSGTWTNVTGGTDPTTSMNIDFQRFKEINDLYIVGATDNPTVAGDFLVTQVVGNEETTPQTKADANTAQFPRAKFVTRWRDRLYFAYCYSTWFTEGAGIKPNRIVYTNVPATGALAGQTINDAAFTNFLDADDPITGMVSTSENLIAWTRYAMWKWDFSTWKRFYDIGCVAQKTIKSFDIYRFWMGQDGIYVESGGKPELITVKIQPIIDAIVDKSQCFSWVDNYKYHTWCGNIVLDGITYQNVVITYALNFNAFYIWKFKLPFTAASTTEHTITAAGEFDNGTNTRAYFVGSNNKAYRMSHENDTTKIYTDGTDTNETYPIEMKVHTKRNDGEMPEEMKRIYPVTVFSKNASGTTIKSRVGLEGGQTEWTFMKNIQNEVERFTTDPSNGYDVQFSFEESGTTEGPEIHGLVLNMGLTTKLHPGQ